MTIIMLYHREVLSKRSPNAPLSLPNPTPALSTTRCCPATWRRSTGASTSTLGSWTTELSPTPTMTPPTRPNRATRGRSGHDSDTQSTLIYTYHEILSTVASIIAITVYSFTCKSRKFVRKVSLSITVRKL